MQYHPALDLDDLAAMLRLSAAEVVEAGVRPDAAAVSAYAYELCSIAEAPEASPELTECHELGPEILEDARRRREIANSLDVLVRPRAQAMR